MPSDLALATRSLARQPAVAAAVVGTLALAVAANTALFSVFDGLLFRPLPFEKPEAIVHLELPGLKTVAEVNALRDRLTTTPLFVDEADASRGPLFEEGVQTVIDWHLAPASVTPDFFKLLGVSPAIGRVFTEDDESPDASPAILGYDLWRLHFGADRSIIGRVVDIPGTIQGRRWMVAGVMPPGFDFPSGTNIWALRAPYRGQLPLPTLARLAPGATIEIVRREFPSVGVVPLRDYVRPHGAAALGFLLGATGLLLVVAWVQIAALLFARASGRTREIGVRLALGATRTRLVRQFAAEGAVVAAAACALSWLVAPMLTTFVVRQLPEAMTVGQSLQPDLRTFAFTCVLSIAGVVLLTLLPAGVVRRTSLAGVLRGRSMGGRFGVARVRSVLVVAQVAVTTVVIYMAGLAAHTFARVGDVPLGFDPTYLVAVRLPLLTIVSRAPAPGATPVIDREDFQRQVNLLAQAEDAIRHTPGVERAAGTGEYPLQVTPPRTQDFTARTDAAGHAIHARFTQITPAFVSTIGARIVAGRDFTADDTPRRVGIVTDGPPNREAPILGMGRTALVNETFARELAPFGPAVGQTVVSGHHDEYRIVGVMNDFGDERPDVPPLPRLFASSTLEPFVLARLSPTTPGAEAAVRATLQRLWSDRASRQVIRMDDEVARATADYRARMRLLLLLALSCLPLAAAGIAGAEIDAVRQRGREIAVRLALGADEGAIGRRVVAQALALVSTGLVVGLAAGIGVGRLMSHYLFETAPVDLASVVLALVVLLAVGWLAAVWPARRASCIRPAVVLRDVE
ncbi:MAG TPA: ABC transporter permease [Vicinamibacterales bacterium]|jgi:predicted permease|nr:ABC transporter permease [Vicinamibacterales bacterium]